MSNYGLVVISRSGSNPQQFIYESDLLTRLQVGLILARFCVRIQTNYLSLFCAEKYQHSPRMDNK